MTVRREFQDTAEGAIHYATAGGGQAVLLLHQTTRCPMRSRGSCSAS